jgi:hypothetical protein
MYFITLKPTININNDVLKDFAKQQGFKYRFDYRMKRWELYCHNAKASKKKIKLIKEYAKKSKCEVWEWENNNPTYKKSVYNKKVE